MNIVEVQDNLKNFSQDQLINEMNQPSGIVPQFLVLTELKRRNRIKQDVEGQQAQNQPTVAQEVVSAAGVPQGGIMDMARSMAPKSSIEQNDGVQMMEKGGKPKNRMDMLLAYLRSLGADEEEEVREATGGKSIAEMINFGGDFRPVEKKADGGVVKMATAGRATREIVYGGKRYVTDGSGRVFKAARRDSMRRGQEITNPDLKAAILKIPVAQSDVGGIGDISTNLDTLSPISSQIDQSPDVSAESSFMNFMGSEALNEGMPVADTGSADMSSVLNMTRGVPAMRDPAVIDPRTGLPYDALGSLTQQAEQARQADAQAAFDRSLPTPDELMVPFNNTPNIDFNNRYGIGQDSPYPDLGEIDVANSSAFIEPGQFDTRPRDADGNLIESSSSIDLNKRYGIGQDLPYENKPEEKTETSKVPDNLLSNVNFSPDIPFLPSGSEDTPDELMVPFNNTPVTPVVDDDDDDGTRSKISAIESEIANMLSDNKEKAEQDKWLALANAGLALMSSSNPTLGGAIGEAGQAGLASFKESQDQYNEDKLSLLALQQRAEAARLASEKKTTKKGPKPSDFESAAKYYDDRIKDLLTVKGEIDSPMGDEPRVRTYEELNDLEKQQYLDLVLQKKVAEESLNRSLFGTIDFDARD